MMPWPWPFRQRWRTTTTTTTTVTTVTRTEGERDADEAIEEARRVIDDVRRRPRSGEPVTSVLRGTYRDERG